MKRIQILNIAFLWVFSLNIPINGVMAQNNCTCAICGVSCNAPASAHTNPSCPVYKNYHYNKSGQNTSVNKTSAEQEIMLNLFSNIFGRVLSGSSKQDAEKARRAEEQKQKELALLIARQNRFNDSIAQVNHDKMMKDYKQLEGSRGLSFKTLNDDTWKASAHFNCKILASKGQVTVFKSNGQSILLSETQSIDLAPGDWIRTGPNSRLKLHYAFEQGGENIILGANSAINIVTNENGSHVPKLLKGDIYVVNNKLEEELADKVSDKKEELTKDVDQLMAPIRKKFSKIEVRTSSAICGIRGTEFTVHVDDFDNTEVNVKNGIVDLTGNLIQGTITLTGGKKGIVKGTGEIVGPLTVDDKTFHNWDQNFLIK